MSDPATCVAVDELMTPSAAPVQPDDTLRSTVGALICADLVALCVTDENRHLVGVLARQGFPQAWWAGRLC
ncbi:MAG: CBS domain-containing protein [Acidimicrobiales bacterium]